jgi:glycosyltransferase involved in cell wall biosynthesis
VIKLLIVIPTYNRRDYLAEQLSRLSKAIQLVENKLEVSVIVRDNGSNYNVNSVVSRYGFELRMNYMNLGGDFNFILGFLDSSNYDYLWILSDDDWVIIEKFKLLVDEIESDTSDLIVLNDGLNCEMHNFYGSNVTEYFSMGTGLISRTIYKVKSIRPYYSELIKFWYTGFPHLAVQLIFVTKEFNHNVTLIKEKLFEEIEVRTMPDSLGYKKSLYGFVGLFSIFDENVRKRLSRMWWADSYLKFKAVDYRNTMKFEFDTWYHSIKKNIHFFRVRFLMYQILIYPIVKYFVINSETKVSLFLRRRFNSSLDETKAYNKKR